MIGLYATGGYAGKVLTADSSTREVSYAPQTQV